ncbi:MAG: DUF6115 domain-containing protein [Clostridium sp.]|nr:DUF6115 domain-containing protein [Clostridium sp.]
MSITGIILIIAGVIVLALGYLLPAKKNDMDEEFRLISEDEVRKLVDREVDGAKEHIFDIIDESVTYAIEKTERSMERVTNEKIMAVNEYSDTVLEEINKNHKEVLFLYDMLNDKHDNLKETISDAAGTAQEVKQTVRDAQITAEEVQRAVAEVEMTVKDADETARNVMEAVLEIKDFDKTIRQNAAVMYKEQTPVYETVEEAPVLPEIEETPYYTTMREELALAYEDEEDIYEAEEPEDEDMFMPITPPRVEIIHDVDGDYVAGGMPEDEDIVEDDYIPQDDYMQEYVQPARPQPMQPQQVKQAQAQQPRRRPAKRQSEAKSVNIQFANGKDKGRNSNDRILELHKAGKSNMAIAKELGLGLGEVKLVIDLFESM